MNFSENLQNLRNSKKMTQEELAEKLDVSRQAVSKWESGSGYPETEKILLICDIFDCSMDSLMKGKISLNETSEKKAYEKEYKLYSKGIAFGVGLILLGVTILVGLTDIEAEILGVIILLSTVLIAVPMFIFVSFSWENFQKRNPVMPHIYNDDEISRYKLKYAIILSGSIAFIILGIIILVATQGVVALEVNSGVINIDTTESAFPAVIFMSFITIAVPIIVYYSIQYGKYDIDAYNKELSPSKENNLIEKACGVIMLSATFIFLGLGFIWDLWHIAWVVFPLGGILCGIVSVILEKS